MNKATKWKMNRAGLLNFWYYDNEIFDFTDGKLLLRGANGSGKSVTMQSLMPVLLDGRKSPDRLDPFGSRARKMEDYLLGEKDVVDRDERTGYLFLEYVREDTNQYITTGIGLQARRDKAMNDWYFVLTDNRRIGEDFALYETETNAGESQDIPLSRKQLENRIGSGGHVVRTAGEYKKLVNKYIFGFDDIEAYDDLIKLLIQLRSPKLSKEFRPTAVYEILEAALPPITDDDLRHLSDTIEHMDQTKQQIEQLEREQAALDKLLERYHAYNEYQLAESAHHYNEAKTRFEDEDKAIREKTEQANKLTKEMERLTERQQTLEQTKDVLEQKQTRLENHKVWYLEKELRDEKTALNEISKDVEKREETQTEKKRREIEAHDEQERLTQAIDTTASDMDDKLVDMNSDATEVSFDAHTMNADDFQRNKDIGHDFSVWKKEAGTHYQQLDTISEQLHTYEALKTQLSDLDHKIAGKRQALDKTRQEEQDWANLFEKDKQEKLNEIHIWAGAHDFLPVDHELLQQTSRDIYQLYEPVGFEAIRKPFVEASQQFQLTVNEDIATHNSMKKSLNDEIKEKETELAEWQAKVDPAPPFQQDATKAARRALTEADHPFIPFYEAVEFQAHVSPEVRGRIEAALLDAGILDALIAGADTPVHHDRLLEPSPHMLAHTLADYLEPDVDDEVAVSTSRIDEVLRSVLIDDDTTGAVTLREDGTYKIGFLSGHAVPVESVRFIGKSARKRYREEQIERVTSEIDALYTERTDVQKAITHLEERIQMAKDAMETFPDDADLSEGFSNLKDVRFRIQKHENELREFDEAMKEAYQEYQDVKGKLDTATRGMNLEFSRVAYQDAKIVMRRYENDLHSFITLYTTYRHNQSSLTQIEERVGELASEVDAIDGELNVLNDKKARKQRHVAEIEKQLEIEGADAIRKEIQTVQDELSETERERDDIKTELPEKRAAQNVLVREMTEQKEKRTFWNDMIEAWSETFNKEMGYRFVSLPDETGTAGARAKWIESHYKTLLKNKDAAKIEEQLTKVFYEQQADLMEYRMADTSVPATEHHWMAGNWDGEEQMRIDRWKEKSSRRLIQLDFQGKQVSPYYIAEKLENDRLEQQTMLDDQDRQLYEDILFDSVGRKLRSRINRAEKWTKEMDKLMTASDSSSGLSFSIKWKPRTAETEAELDTKELVDLLRRNPRLLKEDDLRRVSDHFRSKIDRAKELVELDGEGNTLLQVLRDVLDYRNWFSFELSYRREGEAKRPLTNHAFHQFSGGEKAMAMYIPLFTACYSRYLEAGDTAPYIISLDEAFAGVDENNIREMFEIVEKLGFDYIMNSQVLWGDYDTVSSLAICELIRPKNAPYVTVIRYDWDGYVRRLVMDGAVGADETPETRDAEKAADEAAAADDDRAEPIEATERLGHEL